MILPSSVTESLGPFDVLFDDVVFVLHLDVVEHLDEEGVADPHQVVDAGDDRGKARRIPEDVREDTPDDDRSAAVVLMRAQVRLGETQHTLKPTECA